MGRFRNKIYPYPKYKTKLIEKFHDTHKRIETPLENLPLIK